ncbi:MAG: hypothetical protein GXO23_05825 [Crenarchaeota archaeon]|nr:hypothetical protein [Thermoproteota archaeon]
MHVKNSRGIETAITVIILTTVTIIGATLLLYGVLPFINKETTSHLNVPPPLITSSTIIYDKSTNLYYLLLHIANPNPEYIRVEHILIEYCNGTIIKFISVPKENSTIVPIGEHKFSSTQMWLSSLRTTIDPEYMSYQIYNYVMRLPNGIGIFAPIANVTIIITNIKLLYNILNVSLESTSTKLYPILYILGIGIKYYIKAYPYYSYSATGGTYEIPVFVLSFVIDYTKEIGTTKMEGLLSLTYSCANSSITLRDLEYGNPPLTGGTYHSLYIDLSDIHSITIKLVSHYPLVSNGQENFVKGTLYLYVNNRLIYKYNYNWTLTFVFQPYFMQYVNVSLYVLKFPRVMSFNNVSMNIGIALLNNTTSALISEEHIEASAPSILALTENFTKYIENPIFKPGSGTPQPSSISIKYINHTLVHPEITDPQTSQSYPIVITIRGTLYNYTNMIGPYESKTIALEFTSSTPMSPNECYMITIDTDKGPIIIRNNGFITIR